MTETAHNYAEIMHREECEPCVFVKLGCRWRSEGTYCNTTTHTAATLLERLAADLDRVTKERDAAVVTLKKIGGCTYCKSDKLCKILFPNCNECEKTDCPCHACIYQSNWQWRGVQED